MKIIEYFSFFQGNTGEKQEEVGEEALGRNGGESQTPHHPLAPTEGSLVSQTNQINAFEPYVNIPTFQDPEPGDGDDEDDKKKKDKDKDSKKDGKKDKEEKKENGDKK